MLVVAPSRSSPHPVAGSAQERSSSEYLNVLGRHAEQPLRIVGGPPLAIHRP